MLSNPGEQRQKFSIGFLHLQQRGKLRLPATAAVVDNQLLGGPLGYTFPMVLPNEGQCHVDARCYPSRCPHRTILREYLVWQKFDFWKPFDEVSGPAPMGRSTAAIEKPSLGQDISTRANTANPADTF